MFNKILFIFITIFCCEISNIALSEEIKKDISNTEKLSAEELEIEFWKFFTSIDTVDTYINVIKKYLDPYRSGADKMRGVLAVVNLIKNKVNDGGLISIESLIKNDEDFLNAFLWNIDDILFKKYALQFVLLDRTLKLEEKALLITYSNKLSRTNNGDSMLLKLFDKYSSAVNLVEQDYDLMITALVIAQGNKGLLKDIEDIKYIVRRSSWSGNKSKLKRILNQIVNNEFVFDKKDYVPDNYEFVYEQKTSDSLSDLEFSLDKEQVLGLLKIALKDSGAFSTFFMELDNIFLKEEILKILLKAKDNYLVEQLVLNIFNMYKNKKYLTENDARVLTLVLFYVRGFENQDLDQKVQDVIQTSKWMETSEKEIRSLLINIELLGTMFEKIDSMGSCIDRFRT